MVLFQLNAIVWVVMLITLIFIGGEYDSALKEYISVSGKAFHLKVMIWPCPLPVVVDTVKVPMLITSVPVSCAHCTVLLLISLLAVKLN